MVYFAYGSNLSLKQMKIRCPEAIPMVRVRLKNYKLVYNKYADIIPCDGSEVYGAIYELSLKDLENLDEYEGYPNLYKKIDLKVEDNKGICYEAFAYVMVEKGDEKPDENYVEIIKIGYENWGIPITEFIKM
ncbi:gamma-glutamylcyclotransferase family protein [Clostridium sp. B9]|uniref:gamma-glutamylcyclotransferase family protein n=1 Tax=Clostridium sp. B9 TaxID=3423224 RepID=UPI003D2EB55F